ncbi:MAG TPA: hypothetical protein DCQ30_04495 [Acidimicrobiaceae bacterium]|nr:hypothetical protein [Acidimicrobiaceae bacterium]
MVLLILAIVWAAVLGPSLLRRRSERSTDSIGAFHRQLRVLERAGPTTVDPAHRLDTAYPSGSPFRVSSAQGATFVVRPDATSHAGRAVASRAARRPDPYFRPDACRRRRNVLVGLLSVLVFTGLIGAVPAMRPALFVTIAGAVMVAGYVALLVYLRTLALEREVKLRYLPGPVEADASAVARRIAVR